MTATREGLRVVVLTSTSLGIRAAAALARLPQLGGLTIVTAPAVRRRRSLLEKAIETWRFDGPPGVARAAAGRVRRPRLTLLSEQLASSVAAICPGLPHVHLPDFHAADAPTRLAALAPDLCVVVGTHRLKPALYSVPRLGSINLHFGRAPEYRGSSPAFWELFDGVSSVGLTVHWVNQHLDAGDILLQQRVPIDSAPAGDPLLYIRRYQQETLYPLGFRLLVQAVAGLARGPLPVRRQDPVRGRTRRRATWRDKTELRRRVAARRLTSVG